MLLTLLLQMAVIYLPFMQEVFDTVPLSAADLAISLGCAVLVYFGVEIYKIITRRSLARTKPTH